MGLTTFEQQTSQVQAAGPINAKDTEHAHEMLVVNDGPATVWLASSKTAATLVNGSELGEDIFPLRAGEKLRIGIAPGEEYYFAAYSPVRFYVFYW